MTHSADLPRDPAVLLTALIRESQELREDVAAREKRQRQETAEREARQRKVMMLLGLAVLVALVMIGSVMVLLVQSRQRGNDTRALLRTNAATNQRIADCTTQGGQCYEQGARRSGELISELIRRLLLAQKDIAVCRAQTENGTVAELQACIDTALKPIISPAPAPRVSGGNHD